MPAAGSVGGTTENNGAGGAPKGYVSALAQEMAQPYYQAYTDDENFITPIFDGQKGISLAQPKALSYLQFLPALTIQHIPQGYPMEEAGLFLSPNFFPRIVTANYDLPTSQVVTWTYPNVNNAAWAEALAAAFPGLKHAPKTGQSTVKAFIADKDTIAVQKDSNKKVCGWFNKRYGVYVSYAPHLLFDQEVRAEKLFADPTAQYWESAYGAWDEESWQVGLRNFVEVVVVALCAAYVLGAVGADGSATSGIAGSADPAAVSDTSVVSNTGTDLDSTVIDTSADAPTGDVATEISTGGDIAPSGLTPIDAAGDAVGTDTAVTAGSGVAGDLTSTAIKGAGAIAAADIVSNSKSASPAAAPSTSMPPTGTSVAAAGGGFLGLDAKTLLIIGIGFVAALAL
jgi:hypothetical protein